MVSLNINDLFQGDVLTGGYLFYQDGLLHSIIKTNDTLKVVPTNILDDAEQLSVFPSIRCDLAVLSQTCDIRKTDNPTVIVAPIFRCAIDKANPCSVALGADVMPDLKSYRLSYAYYIPPISLPDGLIYPESYIDLRFFCTVSRSVIESCSKITSLPDGHDSQLRMLLQSYYARPAIPDPIVKAISEVTKKARESKNHPHIYGMWVKCESFTISIVVALNNDNDTIRTRLERAAAKANQCGMPYTVEIVVASKASITLAQTDGFDRFGWDNLSFTDAVAG